MEEQETIKEKTTNQSTKNGFNNALVKNNVSKKDLPESASKAFEVILQECGDYNLYQWKLTFITGFCGLFTSLHNMGAVYLAATPFHTCEVPHLQNENVTLAHPLFNATIPWVRGKEGTLEPSKCHYFAANNTSLIVDQSYHDENSSIFQSLEKISCESWNYHEDVFKSTIVTEWNLVCDKRWLMSTIQASYMMGILSGAVVFSALSDKFGRRTASLICTCLFIAASISAAFTQSFIFLLILRFIVAAAGQGLYLINYVILMELVSAKGRNVMGNTSHALFGVGFLALNAFAYFIRDWRNLQLAISVPTVLLLCYFWILPESCRWLLMQGREEEGVTLLKIIAETNGKQFPSEEELRPLLDVIKNEIHGKPNISIVQKLISILRSVADLVRTPNMRRRNLILFYSWFVVSMLYYGLTFSGATLNVSVYATVTLSAASEFPALILLITLLFIIGRRTLFCIAFLFTGASCVSIMFIPTEMMAWKLALVTLGKMSISIAFGLSFMMSVEVVPTHVRNISVGMASMFARIGSGIAPFIVDLLGDIYFAIPFIIFGALAILGGLLTLLLPETKDKRLPESIDEIEAMPR